MKKMVMILMMVFTMLVGLFAYEPKKENAKVKRNGDVIYYEKTTPYDENGHKPDPKYGRKTIRDYNKWVIRKGYTVKQLVDYRYSKLENYRWSYKYWMERTENPEVTNLTKLVVDFTNDLNGTNETYEEHKVKLAREYAWYEKRTAVLSIPFVTEENFLYMTKADMYLKISTFVEEVKAENK